MTTTETVEKRDGVWRRIVREHQPDGYTKVLSAEQVPDPTPQPPITTADYDGMF